MEYTNWEVRLEGKETYVMVAFIPTEYKLAAGDKVRFTYAHPFQLRKLKII
jgi:plastocyanin